MAVIEASGWDTHANQGAAQGTLAQRLLGLDGALRALAEELGPLWGQTAVLVRHRVRPHGRHERHSRHRSRDRRLRVPGRAAPCGAAGSWPTGRVLSAMPFYENRDLKATLDLRSLFKGVLDEHMRIDAKSLGTRVFPDSSRRIEPFAG